MISLNLNLKPQIEKQVVEIVESEVEKLFQIFKTYAI